MWVWATTILLGPSLGQERVDKLQRNGGGVWEILQGQGSFRVILRDGLLGG